MNRIFQVLNSEEFQPGTNIEIVKDNDTKLCIPKVSCCNPYEKLVLKKEEIKKLSQGLTNFCEQFTDEEIEEYNLNLQVQIKPLPSKLDFVIPGYIYLFQLEYTNKYKFLTIRNIDNYDSEDITLVHKIKSNNILATKRKLENEFDNYLFYRDTYNGKWFELPDFAIEIIKSLETF